MPIHTLLKEFDSVVRRWDFRINRMSNGPLKPIGIERHTVAGALLPLMVLFFLAYGVVAGGGSRLQWATATFALALPLFAWFRLSQSRELPIVSDLLAQLLLVAMVIAAVAYSGTDVFEAASGPYRHVFLLFAAILGCSLLIAAIAARRAFGSGGSFLAFTAAVKTCELFEKRQYPERRFGLGVLSQAAFSVVIRRPLQLLFLPAVGVVLAPAELAPVPWTV